MVDNQAMLPCLLVVAAVVLALGRTGLVALVRTG
jgi:hypothetical protein